MAKQKKTEPNEYKAIAFRAPNTIHGALKTITGKLEMRDYRIDGRVPFERDILVWLVAELYMDGPEKWRERLEKANEKFKQLGNQ